MNRILPLARRITTCPFAFCSLPTKRTNGTCIVGNWAKNFEPSLIHSLLSFAAVVAKLHDPEDLTVVEWSLLESLPKFEVKITPYFAKLSIAIDSWPLPDDMWNVSHLLQLLLLLFCLFRNSLQSQGMGWVIEVTCELQARIKQTPL